MSMLAWTATKRGAPTSTLTLNSIPRPTTVPKHHILVKVTHCALNPSTAIVMKILPNPRRVPRVPEMDFAGIVVEAGDDVREQLQAGARVFGLTFEGPMQVLLLRMEKGTLTEYIVVHQSFATVAPENIALKEAAGLGAAGCTALNFLDYSKIGRGDSVLIIGGSGGVGTFLVQIARMMVGPEGKVVATCSGANVDMVKALGADEVIDYNEHDPLEEYLAMTYGKQKFAAIIDTVGIQSTYTHCPAYLAEGKPYLNVGVSLSFGPTWDWWGTGSLILNLGKNYLWPSMLGGTPRQFTLLPTPPDEERLARVARLAAEGTIKCVVDSVWPMEEAMKGYQKLETHRAKGKILIEVQKDGN